MQYASNLQKGSIESRSSSQGRHNRFEIHSRGAFLFSNPCLLHIFSHVRWKKDNFWWECCQNVVKTQTHSEIISIHCGKGVFLKGVKELQCIQRKGCLMQSTTHNAATSGLHPKGQLISKGLFDVIVSTKKPTEFFKVFLSLASKKRLDQKTKALYITN